MVVGVFIFFIVVDVGIEIGEVAVQVYFIRIVFVNQIFRDVQVLKGKGRYKKMKVLD